MTPRANRRPPQGWDEMQIEAPRVHFYVFFAMLAGRWSKGEGLGERVNPLRQGLDTFDQRLTDLGVLGVARDLILAAFSLSGHQGQGSRLALDS